MIFPCLNGLFGYVPSMIVGWYQLVSHGGGGDCFSVVFGDFVVKDLVLWCNVAGFHAYEGARACKDEFSLRSVFGGFNPDGIAGDMVEDHLISKTSAGNMWKLSSLVGVQCVVGVIGLDEDVILLWVGWCRYDGMNLLFGGAYALALIFHVSLLSFLRLWKMFVHIFNGD